MGAERAGQAVGSSGVVEGAEGSQRGMEEISRSWERVARGWEGGGEGGEGEEGEVEAASQADRVLWSTGQPSAAGAGAAGEAGEVNGHICELGERWRRKSQNLGVEIRFEELSSDGDDDENKTIAESITMLYTLQCSLPPSLPTRRTPSSPSRGVLLDILGDPRMNSDLVEWKTARRVVLKELRPIGEQKQAKRRRIERTLTIKSRASRETDSGILRSTFAIRRYVAVDAR